MINNNQLFILKKYNEHEGYLHELQVLKLDQIYHNIFIDHCDNMINQNHVFQYIVCNYSKFGSLCQFGQKIKQFPIDCVKFYIHSIFTQLKIIYENVNTPFRQIYHSDIIVAENFKVFIVGWSKIKSNITLQQMVYDCGQIMYYMLTNSIPQQKSMYLQKNKKRFLSESYWDTSKKKNSYIKYLPKQQKQQKKWIQFLKYITTQNNNIISINNILQHQFFNQILPQQQILKKIQQKYLQKKTKSKQKHFKNFQFKLKIDQIIKKYQQQENTRSISNHYQIVNYPIVIDICNQQAKIRESSTQKQLLFKKLNIQGKSYNVKQTIKQLIYKFLDSKLSLAITPSNSQPFSNPHLIFAVDWIQLIDYKLTQQKSCNQNQLRYQIKCEYNFLQKQGLLPDIEQICFQICIELNERKDNVQIQQKMHQVLLEKFREYVGEELKEFLVYGWEH